MLIRSSYPSYDPSRQSRPWIAAITYDGKRELKRFGEFVGNQHSGGVLELEIEPGGIFAVGAKLFRKTDRGTPHKSYYVANESGKHKKLPPEVRVCEYWHEHVARTARVDLRTAVTTLLQILAKHPEFLDDKDRREYNRIRSSVF